MKAPELTREIGRACALMIALFVTAGKLPASTTGDYVSDLPIEDLVKLRVAVGTLGGSELGKVPASVTTISGAEISESGARNLNELLEMYVPNLLYLRHNWEASHIGLRGVVGDIDNKYLLLVNGKVMNNVVHAGALSERDLALLGDIKEIHVVRGPGSAVYGAGALLGVIDIRTYDGKSFQGTELKARAGRLEEFYSVEFKHGRQLGENVHLFLYGGISQLVGASNDDAPLILALSGQTFDGTPIRAGRPYPVGLYKDRSGFRDQPQLKFHAELTAGDFSFWTRFTRGGERQPLEQRWLIQWPLGFAYDDPDNFHPHEIGYQQLSFGADYRRELSEHWRLDFRLGYSLDDYVRREFDVLLDANREDLYSARALATWESSDDHALTFGFEFLHGEFGLPTLGYPEGRAMSIAWEDGRMPRWSTDTYSVLVEDRWDITSEWTLFTGGRMDKNDYTDYMFSPRAALVFAPTKKDTFKLIASQAVKANVAEELRWQHEDTGEKGDTETLRALELSYHRLFTERFSAGANVFYNYYDIIGWDGRTRRVGEAQIIGFELEAAYRTEHFRFSLSHGYSQLLDFRNATAHQFITAQPYGFGRDLNHWSTHITKLHFSYQPVDRLRLFGSLRVFWGWPGWKDYSDYENMLHESFDPEGTDDPGTFLRDANYNPYDKIQARLNLGVTYDLTRNVSAGVHGYNLLGLFDEHLNDRFVMFSSSAQRDATAVAFTLSCKF